MINSGKIFHLNIDKKSFSEKKIVSLQLSKINVKKLNYE